MSTNTSTVVSVRFPLGRYHATPWDHAHNEGRVEWPPSPWRLLRALLAVWHQRAPELDHTTIDTLIRTLAATPPSYALPTGTTHGHTRHYMPGVDLDAKNRDHTRTLTLDAFLALPHETHADGPGALLINWDVDLGDEERKALTVLTQRLPYLGRADSICVAELLDTPPTRDHWITPDSDGDLRLLAPTAETTVEQLEIDTRQLRRQKRLNPPGSQWITYRSPDLPTSTPRRRPGRRRPTAIRLALDTPAPIHHTDTLLITDALRRACLGRYGRQHRTPDGQQANCPPLSGKDNTATPNRGRHDHAHYLATSSTESPYLDTAIIWLPAGFDPDVLRAVTTLRTLHLNPTHTPTNGIHVAVEHVGDITDTAPEWTPTEPVTTWTTLTPICFRRHRKKNETIKEFVTTQLTAELAHELNLDPTTVLTTITPHHPENPHDDWPTALPDTWARQYRRHRPTQTMRNRLDGLGLTLHLTPTAATALTTRPLLLGAHRHFGLGLLHPMPS